MKDKDGKSVPSELVSALERDMEAFKAWENMPRSQQREYTRWINDGVGENMRLERAQESLLIMKKRVERISHD